MILYSDDRAPNPRRVRIFLMEKGIEVEIRTVDILKDEHKSPEFAKLSPLHRLPVLQLGDGSVIAESVAICRYFEELHPEPPLMGKDRMDRVMVEMWQRQVEFNLLWQASQVMRHLVPALAVIETPQVPDWGRANIPKLHRACHWLDDVLAQQRYVAGDDFTIADITALCAIDFAKFARIEIAPEHEHLRLWYNEVSSRSSAGA
jgi:glutathione S-transferase